MTSLAGFFYGHPIRMEFFNSEKRINVNLGGLCRSNGFCLEEQSLAGRLWAVLIKPKIVVKKTLSRQRKRQLVFSGISHLVNCLDCRLAIFWQGQRQWLHL